jgi:hypothetical protein
MKRFEKHLSIIAILILGSFYLYGFWLSAHPNVSLAYRLYFIEQKLLRWSKPGILDFNPGATLDFRVPVANRSLVGWEPPSNTGTRLRGANSELYFDIEKYNQPKRIVLKARTILEAGRSLRLRILANEAFIGESEFNSPEWRELEFVVPASLAAQANSRFTLRFEVIGDANTPVELEKLILY